MWEYLVLFLLAASIYVFGFFVGLAVFFAGVSIVSASISIWKVITHEP